MTDFLREYRVRIRNAADSADLLVLTTRRGDVAPNYPYLAENPVGDGASFEPDTGASFASSYTFLAVDAITSGTLRVITAQLEDGSQRLQLGYLKAFVEEASEGGGYTRVLCAGYLVLLNTVDDITFHGTVQDASRLQGGLELFGLSAGTLIADYLTAFPNRGVIAGGPIMGSFLNAPDWGGWTMHPLMVSTIDGYDTGRSVANPGDVVLLEAMSVYGPPDWRASRPSWDALAKPINEAAARWPHAPNIGLPPYNLRVPSSGATIDPVDLLTIDDVFTSGWWGNGVIALVKNASALSTDPFVPYRVVPLQRPPGAPWQLLGDNSHVWSFHGLALVQDNQAAPLDKSQAYRVRILTIGATRDCPILFDGHPTDLLTASLTLANLPYDAATAASVKADMGDDLRLATLFTEPLQLSRIIDDYVKKPFDLSTYADTLGRLVPFLMNSFANTPPSKTITDDNIDPTDGVLAFEQDVSQGLQRITFKQKAYVILANTPNAIDSVDDTLTLLNPDANALASGTLDITVDGMIRKGATAQEPVGLDWIRARGMTLFDRFGRGNQQFEATLIAGDGTSDVDTTHLGEELNIASAQLPNHNKRYGDDNTVGARCMQVLRVTDVLGGRRARLADSGPNAQPIATLPVLTIAKSTDRPRNVAKTTITNAAALTAAGYGVRVQVAVGTSPTSYQDAHVYFPGETIPATAKRLHSVTQGSTVWARARTEKSGSRPSNWSTPVSVALDALNPPTSFVAKPVPTDGSLEDFTWVNGANAGDCIIEVWIRDSTQAFAVARKDADLDQGSVSYRMDSLQPNTPYIASVRHRDPVTHDVSARVDVAFTTANVTYQMKTPASPHAFSSGVQHFGDLFGEPLYGIAAVAREFRGQIEVWEAIETGIASNAYGSYQLVGLIEPVARDWSKWQRLGSLDKRRHQLKLRAVRTGTTPSAFTTAITIDILTQLALPDWPSGPMNGLTNFRWTDSADGTQRTFTMTCGVYVDRVYVFAKTVPAPPTTDPWPGVTGVPDFVLTPNGSFVASLTIAKPKAHEQSFLQFEPRLVDKKFGPVKRAIVQPHAPAMSTKVAIAITSNAADLTIEVTAGPNDWPVQLDVYEDDPTGAPIYSASFSANASVDKLTSGASALGGRVLTSRPHRQWWSKLTNVAGQSTWASAAAKQNVVPLLDSFALTWDEATGKLRARAKGSAFCVSALIELSTSSSFATVTYNSAIVLGDGDDVTFAQLLAFADRGRTWYARVTPYNSPAQAGLAGVALVAECAVPVVAIGGQDGQVGAINCDGSGNTTVLLDGGAWVQSWKVATSTSAQPSDADALAGTTQSGRQPSFASSVLDVGQPLYVTAIPFSGAAATNYQGPSIRMRFTRHDTTNVAKRLYFAMSMFNNNSDEITLSGSGNQYGGFTLPVGVLVTAFGSDINVTTPSTAPFDQYEVQVGRKDPATGAITIIAFGLLTLSASGAQTATAVSSETTVNKPYFAQLLIIPGAGIHSVLKVYTFYVDYTMPNHKLTY